MPTKTNGFLTLLMLDSYMYHIYSIARALESLFPTAGLIIKAKLANILTISHIFQRVNNLILSELESLLNRGIQLVRAKEKTAFSSTA